MARRSLGVHLLVVGAGGLILAYLFFAIHQLLGAQSLFEALQQQRILNQRYAKEVLLAASGVPVNYEKTADEWTRVTELLSRGGVIRMSDDQAPQKVQPPASATRFQDSIGRMIPIRQEIVRESGAYLESAKKTNHRAQLFDELYRQSLELQAAGDALVHTYDKHLTSGVSWWDVNAVAVEMAERQRMLIQQHIKEVLFVAHGIPADYQATRLRLYESIKMLAAGGQIAVEGGESIVIPAPSSADVRFNLDEQKNSLDRFTAVSNQYLMMSNEEVERSIQLKKILDLTGDYHASATQILAQYRSLFEGRVRRASREAGAAAILLAVFMSVLGWAFMKKYVDIPAAQMVAVLRRLRSGKKEIASEPVVSGPLGAVSLELRQLEEQWKSRQNWFDRFLSSDDADELEDPGSQDPVAARVYRWYKDRGAEAPASRWSAADESDDQITVIGRLPDPEPSGKDSELLDQLIRRANELQGEQEAILRTRDRLAEEAEALRNSEAGLTDENRRLKSDHSALLAQSTEQLEEIRQLRGRLEGLQKSEAAISAGTEEIRRVNSELLANMDRQSDELRIVRSQLQTKVREFESFAKEARHRDEASRAQIADLTQRLAAADDLRVRLEAEMMALAQSRQSDQAAAVRKLQMLQGEKIASLESARRDHSSQLEVLRRENEAVLSKLKLEHDALLDSLKTEHAVSIRSLAIEHSEALALERSQQGVLIESVRSDHAAALRMIEEIRFHAARLERELEESRRTIQRDQEIISSLENALGTAERGLLDLKLTLERSAEEIRIGEEAKEVLANRILDLENHAGNLEEVRAEQLRQIHRQEALIAELQQALARQTRALETLRQELSEALSRHSAELDARDAKLRQSEGQIAQAHTRLVETQSGLLEARARLAETQTALENRESELWKIRKELADHERDLSHTRQEVERLRLIESQQSASITEMRHESSRMQTLLASKTQVVAELEAKQREMEEKFRQLEAESQMTRRRLEAESEMALKRLETESDTTRRRLEAELASSRDAHSSKCQALALAEERLSATRNALKSALDELQERSSR